MGIVETIGEVGAILAALIVGLILGRFLPSYAAKKGENIATKEDIDEITSKIQAVKSRHRKAIESLRSELRRTAVEHEVRFSRLHQRRAEVIERLYKLLVVALWDTETAASPLEWVDNPGKRQQGIDAQNSIARFFRFFDKNRLFLPESLCQVIEAFTSELRKPLIHFDTLLSIEHPNARSLEKLHDLQAEMWDAIRADVPKQRAAMEEEFRRLLGAAPDLGNPP